MYFRLEIFKEKYAKKLNIYLAVTSNEARLDLRTLPIKLPVTQRWPLRHSYRN